ncbi:hypothetical protein BC828DRAFT_399797 [Blastocladiella britannica]|nr:hypothetical protein BC828DRAFT_399797 [Blastocladiella britannica]
MTLCHNLINLHAYLGDPNDPRTFYVKRAPADHPDPDYLPMIMGFAQADMTTNSLLDLVQRFGTQAKTINDPLPSAPRPNTASVETAALTHLSDATACAEATKRFGTVFKEHCHEDAIDLFVMMRSWLTVLAMKAAMAVLVVENLFPQLCGNHTAAITEIRAKAPNAGPDLRPILKLFAVVFPMAHHAIGTEWGEGSVLVTLPNKFKAAALFEALHSQAQWRPVPVHVSVLDRYESPSAFNLDLAPLAWEFDSCIKNLLVRIVEGTVSPAPLATFYCHHHHVEVGVWDMLAAYAAVTFEKGSGIWTIELHSNCVLVLSVSELGLRSNTATTSGALATLHSSVPLPRPRALGQKTSGGHYPARNHGRQQQNAGRGHDREHRDRSSFPSGPTSVIGGITTAGGVLTTCEYCSVLDGIKHHRASHIGIAHCQSINNIDTILHQLKKAAATLVHIGSLTRDAGTFMEHINWVDGDPDHAAQAVHKIIADMATSSSNCEDATMARVLCSHI